MSDSPYEQGYQAYCDGTDLESNPYPHNSNEADQWDAGWCDALDEDNSGGWY